MTVVKICGLTNLEDARWAWLCGADLLGFVFVPSSPRYIAPAQARRIIADLRAEGCTAGCVGVFVNEPLASCRRIIWGCRLDFAQLHGDESPAYAADLGTPAIIARRVQEHIPWDELACYQAWAYLLDSYHPHQLGGTGHTWPWDLMQDRLRRMGRWILAGGLSPDNVAQAIRQANPWGVDVSSGVEARPGRKDSAKVQSFIQRVREEEPA